MNEISMFSSPPLFSDDLKPFLRPAREPMRHVSDADTYALLLEAPRHYLEFLEGALRDIASGEMELIMQPKTVFEDGPGLGDFRVMPCVTKTLAGVTKTVKIVGTNLAQYEVPDQITVGKALMLHPEENYVTHLFDANALSSIRTGACVALGVKFLARQRQRMTFIGAGRVGYYSALFCSLLEGVESIRFADRDAVRADALATHFASRFDSLDVASANPGDSRQADVVVLATTSTEPLCHPSDWAANLVVSVGADSDYQRELDPAWATCADIYVDIRDSLRLGDLRKWSGAGLVSAGDIPDIFGILGGVKESSRPRLFVSTGSALFDNLTMAYVVERLAGRASQSAETKSSNL